MGSTVRGVGVLMFGAIDIPEGGKLPPAPTYLCTSGAEIQSSWINITRNDSKNQTYIPFANITALALRYNTMSEMCWPRYATNILP